MDEVSGPEPDEASAKCPNGHVVPAEQAYCGVCGRAAQPVGSGGFSPREASGKRRAPIVALAVLVALLAAIGTAAAMRGSGEGKEEPSQAVSPEPADATTSAPPPTMQELCVQEVLAIVEPAVEEFAATGHFQSAMQRAQGEYGAENPLFLMTMQRVLPQAMQVAVSYGRDQGLQAAATEAEAACRDELAAGVADEVTEPTYAPPPLPDSPGPGESTAVAQVVDCRDLGEVQCQEANQISKRCDSEPSSIVRQGSTAPGLTKWQYLGLDDMNAYTTFTWGEYKSGAFVASCGTPSNGINVVAAHKALLSQAEGWLDKVVAITCHTANGVPLDEMPVGSSISCDVWDESGFPNQAKVTVVDHEPGYEATLLFGD